MDMKKIKALINLAKEEGLGKIKFKEKDFEVELNFAQENSFQPQQNFIPSTSQVHGQAIQPTASQSTAACGHEVKSPFVGTFYSSSAPGEPAFVKVGDKVSRGQVLCIIEAMKIMNEIEADADGVVEEILVKNENLVEFDQPLFRLKV